MARKHRMRFSGAMGRAVAAFETLSWIPELFPAESLDESRRLLAEYVKDERGDYPDIVRAAAEGPHAFKKRIRKVIGMTLYRAELPRSYRALARPPLSEVFAGTRRTGRRLTILRAHIVHGYLLREIADYLELHPTTVSRIVNQTGDYRLTRA